MNHKDSLRKYVDKNVEFKGEILFHRDHAYIFHADNNIATEGFSYLHIKSIPLVDKLDYLPDGDIEDERVEYGNCVTGGGSVKFMTIEAGAPGSPPKSPPKSPGKGQAASTGVNAALYG